MDDERTGLHGKPPAPSASLAQAAVNGLRRWEAAGFGQIYDVMIRVASASLTDTQARFPADQNGRGSTCLELKVCHAIPSPSSKITRQGLADAGLYWHFAPNPSR